MVMAAICCRAMPAYGVLISREGERISASEAEKVVSGNRLYRKESEPLFVPYVVRQTADRNRRILVSYETQGFTGTFIARQRTSGTRGLLSDEPHELDLKILRLISRGGIASVEDYAVWLKENISYKEDEGADIWALPEETLSRGYGDCEDFAFLTAAVLRVFGYTPVVLGLGSGVSPTAHAICAFKKDGVFLWFDNDTLKTTAASSWEEFLSQIVFGHGYAYHFEIFPDDILRQRLSHPTAHIVE